MVWCCLDDASMVGQSASCTAVVQPSRYSHTTPLQRTRNDRTTVLQRLYNGPTTVLQQSYNGCSTAVRLLLLAGYFFLEMGKLEFLLFPVRSHAPPNGTDGEISESGWRQSDGAVGWGECSLSVRRVKWSLGRTGACRKNQGSCEKPLP